MRKLNIAKIIAQGDALVNHIQKVAKQKNMSCCRTALLFQLVLLKATLLKIK